MKFRSLLEKIKVSKKIRKYLITTFLIGIISLLVASLFVFFVNLYVLKSTEDNILTPEGAEALQDVDCILVLGCGVWNDTPSHLLADRLEKGIELHDLGVSSKLLMSGDHGHHSYNEVTVMKQYAIDAEISSTDIFMDHAGFSTYESMYRAKEIFGAEKIVIVTQEYHLSRAIYIAESLGLEAYGVPADYREYSAQSFWNAREALARVKDFFYSVIKPNPTYLGEPIDLSGSGDITNDEFDDFK